MPSFPAEEYSLETFKKLGFNRKLCKEDGEFYWVHQDFKGRCGEAPLVGYTFIGNPMGRTTDSLEEVRNRFLGFFEHNNHTVIQPYPVVSRWRNDLYLTDASIVDFQPYVTDGLIPAPANPLVISQPCIRLVDLDNVGRTFGKHMSIFEMGGHHAFNYPDKEVYWKEETLQYCHDFIQDAMGIPGKEILYKESYWAGGGNAGPCFEVIAGGLEVATLVFMRFKVSSDGSLSELPIRTVDTGYGIERFLWVSSGASSSTFVVHPALMRYLIQEAKIRYDEDLASDYAMATSNLGKVVTNVQTLREIASRKLKVSTSQLESSIGQLEKAFKVADHTKSLVFILAEGVVPSNVGVGYLARLLFRRSVRNLRALGLSGRVLDVIRFQADYWSRWFPILKEQEDEILKVASAELSKYEKTYEKSSALAGKFLEEKGATYFTTENLLELYDSNGLTPEEVGDVLTNAGAQIQIPEDFYALVASRHAKELTRQQVQTEAPTLPKDMSNLPPTVRAYYSDPELLRTKAKVVGVLEPDSLILDKTIFYAEGGGQPSDTGKIYLSGKQTQVVDVRPVQNLIVHKVQGPMPQVGDEVSLEVDEERRLALRRAHTGTHAINWAARQVLGGHIWQHGAQKDVLESRLDITHYNSLNEEEVFEIERRANDLAMKALPVKTEYLDRTEAEKRYGFRIYQGGVVPSKTIRIVSVDDYEVEACGGLHVSNTGQIGLIKITKTEKIQDGVVRLWFTTGRASLDHFEDAERNLKAVSTLLRTDKGQVIQGLTRLIDEAQSAKKRLEQLKLEDAKVLAKELVTKGEAFQGVKVVFHSDSSRSIEDLIEASKVLVSTDPSSVSVFVSMTGENPEFVVVYGESAKIPSGLMAGDVARGIAKKLGGGGGGREKFGKGGVRPNLEPKSIKDEAVRLLISGR